MLTRTTSAVLPRGRNSLTLRVRGRSIGTQSKFKIGSLKPRFPLEIIETIVGFVLLLHPFPKSGFLAIRSFTQGSKMLREISLRLYFRDVLLDDRALFVKVWDYLSTENAVFGGSNSFGWVRSLIGPSHIVASSAIKNIGSFVNLKTLELSFASEGSSTQDSVIHRLLDSFLHSPSRNILEKLALTEVPHVDAKLLESLSGMFPRLESLELGSTKRIESDCCIVCMEDSLVDIRHSPIPDYYANAEKLATSFARSLAPMSRLKHLYLGLLLSDAYALEDHLTHSDEAKGGRGVVTSFSSCLTCDRLREETQRREWLVSLSLSRALPSLDTIRWDTLFTSLARGRTESDEDGFYYASDDGFLQVPSAVTFLIHRHTGSGEVRTMIPVHS
ncbi:hypothetical protein D9756_002655 [Leucocoprinus leucothites]|uniref:Uncharacterized protein n=1 Tax=Leucocoprinus leucothites TaxID=201217 RepID=A0A8H5GD54_9AGAR|nr:hypothetical protein D9756_002655 [Leucoagaricus leucothites]